AHAHPHRESQHGDGGEPTVRHEQASSKAQVLPERVDDRPPPLVSVGLFDLLDAAELAPSRSLRLLPRQAGADIVVCQSVEMGLDLVAELFVPAVAAEE